ncbi:hypothetical protein EDB86DRAFT_868290 [Lactarius hatsudake]|nr:hypothetical protein EDB86DRAFT_868290 [Lactarius hatsudake]
MRYHRIFFLSILAGLPLAGLAASHSPRWGEMRSKHSWAAVPEDRQCLGPLVIQTLVQIWCTPVQGASRQACCSASTVEARWSPLRCPCQRSSRGVIPVLRTRKDERDYCHALPATLHEHVQTVAQNARSGRYPATVMAGQQRGQQVTVPKSRAVNFTTPMFLKAHGGCCRDRPASSIAGDEQRGGTVGLCAEEGPVGLYLIVGRLGRKK